MNRSCVFGILSIVLMVNSGSAQAQDGTLKWALRTGGIGNSAPAVGAEGTIYVGSFDDKSLYAINPDGTLKWTFRTRSSVDTTPSIARNGTIYIASADTRLYALRPDGTLKWFADISGSSFAGAAPAIGADGTVYVGVQIVNIPSQGLLWAFDPAGTVKWVKRTSGGVHGGPSIGPDGTIYVSARYLYAIRPDGTVKWQRPLFLDQESYSSPAIGADGTLYVGSREGELLAVHPAGVTLWAFQAAGAINSSPVIGADGTIYVGSLDGNLYAINADGSQKWAFLTGGEIGTHAPVVGADGTVYVGSSDGKLYAINPDGSLKWAFQTSGEIANSPAVVNDGTLYVGSFDVDLTGGNLYAIQTSSAGLADSSWPIFFHDRRHTGRARILALEASFSSGTLRLDFEVGTPVPATWELWLSADGSQVRLWSIPLPVIDPPIAVPVSVSDLPPLGTITLLTILTTPEGILGSDMATVDTGPPFSQPDIRELEKLLNGLIPLQ